jgi:starch phosphorylase
MAHLTFRPLPPGLEPLSELALDLRWSWSHAADALWRRLSPEIWEQTENPWIILQAARQERLEELARDPVFLEEFGRVVSAREQDLTGATWYAQEHAGGGLGRVAYFSMEYGLGEALPLYAGGLGILAGDHLKAASDLGVPLVGMGLLYQEGYFRQMVGSDGRQQETYPYNDPAELPVRPALAPDGSWITVTLPLPGRRLSLRIWHAGVGRISLYLLDSNDPLNGPFDRGITGKLYGGGPEMRLLQEMVLGIGGWRALEILGVAPDVCHLNEGHAAFAALARAQGFARRQGLSFSEALWATRAGNVFTTHTSVAAGFDLFAPSLIQKYFRAPVLGEPSLAPEELLALGRRSQSDGNEPLNMAYLAMRCCSRVNAVSRLHGEVSRRLFKDLFPRWPLDEVPVGHVTNGVHVPSWSSEIADRLWTGTGGKARWRGTSEASEALGALLQSLSDAQLWAFRAEGRQELIRYARERLGQQLGQRGEEEERVAEAQRVLDPNALTLGFARRFAEYKRPNLLLADPDRLERLLDLPERPVQLVIAGKAHPADELGKRLVKAWIDFANRPRVRRRAVFLEDYDIALAEKLVQGVDVWVNTPRRPWEACGTSGMKVLANGGLNLSELDGWWAEAYEPGVGWALGDRAEHPEPGWDAAEAEEIYRILEQEVIPAFYQRDAHGIPVGWVQRMRASLLRLAPQFSTNRMMREYVEQLYLPAAQAFARRTGRGGTLARELRAWSARVAESWEKVRLGEVRALSEGDAWQFEAHVYAGEIPLEQLRVELYAEARGGAGPERHQMIRAEAIAGALSACVYHARAPAARPASDYTVRVLPFHPEARLPIEDHHILWQR